MSVYLTGILEDAWFCNYCGLLIPADKLNIIELDLECAALTFCDPECSVLYETGKDSQVGHSFSQDTTAFKPNE